MVLTAAPLANGTKVYSKFFGNGIVQSTDDRGIMRVHAPRYLDGKRVQLLDIYYSGVGILHELTPEEMEEAFQHHLAQRNKEKTA